MWQFSINFYNRERSFQTTPGFQKESLLLALFSTNPLPSGLSDSTTKPPGETPPPSPVGSGIGGTRRDLGAVSNPSPSDLLLEWILFGNRHFRTAQLKVGKMDRWSAAVIVTEAFPTAAHWVLVTCIVTAGDMPSLLPEIKGETESWKTEPTGPGLFDVTIYGRFKISFSYCLFMNIKM